jgi:hypothetical protein
MLVIIVILLLDLVLVYHASRTGRLQPWVYVIMFLPVGGAIAYVVVELIPEWFGSPQSQQARRRLADRFDPERTYRELADRLAVAATIANRVGLAHECLRSGRYAEAERLYDDALKLPMGQIPAYALGKAYAQFRRQRPADALATLDDLQARWPEFSSEQAHLLYAQALTAVGRVDEALQEYQSLMRYFPVGEVRVRYGLLLQSAGRHAEARIVFNEFLIHMRRAPKYLRRTQAEWLRIAEKQLSG